MTIWNAWVIVEWLLRIVMVLVILRRRFPPTTALAWIGLSAFVPELGVIFYLMFGSSLLGKRRARKYRALLSTPRPGQRRAQGSRLRSSLELANLHVIKHAERISGMPIVEGNEVELLAEPMALTDRLIADIDRAQHHVHMLYYIFDPDEVGTSVMAALERAASRGVRCRLLADAAGSRALFAQRQTLERLRERSVEVRAALPVQLIRRKLARLDLRNHRKLAVIDGASAYTGSQNIVRAQFGHHRAGRYVDLSVRFRGPVVSQLQMVFLDDWLFDTGQELDSDDLFPQQPFAGETAAQAVPTGPTQDNESLVRVILAALSAAERKVIITSPYFVPDEPTTLALLMAAERGVEVNLVLPAVSDHPLVSAAGRSYYETFLEAGIHIYQHHVGMLHAKTITVDDAFALLGSSNLDVRSFYLNFEINVLLYGPEITRSLRFAQTRYIQESTPIDLSTWRRRPRWHEYRDSAAGLLSPLL